MNVSMKAVATISCASGYNNQRSMSRSIIRPVVVLISSVFVGTLLGCVSNTAAPIEIPTWELANAEPIKPIILGRARVSFDRPLQSHLVQTLSPEFSLITIAQRDDWEEVRRRLQLQPTPPLFDLSSGLIVGILADVGEYAVDGWPIHLTEGRSVGGIGWIEASFTAGLYYPLKTASYVELAFIPGLRAVSVVQINHRMFFIKPPWPAN